MVSQKNQIKIDIFFSSLNIEYKTDIVSGLTMHIDSLIKFLGVPGNPKIEINQEYIRNKQEIKLLINNQRCWYSEELLQRVFAFGQKKIFENKSEEQIWNTLPTMLFNTDNKFNFLEFIVLFLIEIVKTKPSVLLGIEQFNTFWDSLSLKKSIKEGADSELCTNLYEVFKEILDLRISLNNKEVIEQVISDAIENGLAFHEIREELISKLSTQEVGIYIHKEYFKEITNIGSNENYFELMRDGLFHELGICFPAFKIYFVEELDYGTFQFKINDLMTLPIKGLASNKSLVNDTVDRLKLINVNGLTSVNPANNSESSIISNKDVKICEKVGLTIWNSLGYFILYFSSILKLYGKCFITKDVLDKQLAQLSPFWPQLIRIFKHTFSPGIRTKIFRLLLSEEISIRNLNQIIEGALNADFIETDPAKYIVLDRRVPEKYKTNNYSSWKKEPKNLIKYIRSQMKAYISHKYTKGTNTLIVYLLDTDIEQMIGESLLANKQISEENIEHFLLAVDNEMFGSQFSTTQNYIILTTTTIRDALKQMIETRFPKIIVLAYRELSLNLKIQPIGRISM